MQEKNIVIGGAWPYANSDLHLGHIAGLISGDVLARYFRAKGYNVVFVSGTDCHGTPITERAKKEHKSPKEIAEYYDKRDRETLSKFNFSYDLYTNTDTDFHRKEVMEMFKKIYDNGYIYEKIEPQPYCENCKKFLSDREIQITCPKCGTQTKAEQCDGCQYVPTIDDMKDGICLECGAKTVLKDNKNLYLALSKFQDLIAKHTEESNKLWRANAKNETSKYLKQGLVDRAVTRDLDWGVDIPVDGYENKKMYVWIDAVLGYTTATKKWCEDNGKNWEDFWKEGNNNEIYMVHGKDNIVFHSIILNALLLAMKENYHLVDVIVSSEYLNINDEKISKSKGNGIPAIEIVEQYNPDTLRFHLINNGPEKKDSNFTIDSLVATNNGELLNKFGNLVNRTLKFKGIEEVLVGTLDKEVETKIDETYRKVGKNIEKLEFKEASDIAMELVEFANKYYDEKQPWVQKKENIDEFNNTIYNCTVIIANLSNIFEPFMPGTCEKIREYLKLGKCEWKRIELNSNIKLENIQPLFNRIDNVEKNKKSYILCNFFILHILKIM